MKSLNDIDDGLSILAQMRQGTAARFKVSVRDFSVHLRPLTIDETIQVASETADHVSSLPKTKQTGLMENRTFSIKTLCLASTPSPDETGSPTLTEYVLGRCTAEELTALFKEYVAMCDKLNPVLETMPTERLKSLVEVVKKNDSTLTELSFTELVSVCRALIQGD